MSAQPSDNGGFVVAPGDRKRPGALLSLPFDRELIARLRQDFPRARFRGLDGRWFVPGTTAQARLGRWIDRERTQLDIHADARGRDAFAFDPIESPYLETGDDLVVRTPYSRTVVETLRGLPLARWDPAIRAWRLPFRALEPLRRVWATIEAGARRNEPGAKRDRAATPSERKREAERRRRRLPVPRDDPPPLGLPLATAPFGIVVFEAIDAGPPLDPGALRDLDVPEDGGDRVWAWWHPPTWRELSGATTAASVAETDRLRGWWCPTQEMLDAQRRLMRRSERARASRMRRRQRDEASAVS